MSAGSLINAFPRSGIEVPALDLPVTGRIPEELNGRYLRKAMGGGMVRGVRMRDGRAEWYRSRWIRAATVAARLGEPHAKVDPRNGELHSISYDSDTDHVKHVVIDSTGRPTRLWRIDVGEPLVMHDFALTERYLVIYDQHRVGVMRRAGGLVRWFPVRPSVVSHTLNAYDDGRTITIHLVSFPATGSGAPRLDRWSIDLTRGRVREQRIDDRPQEYPRMNEAFVGQPHRYGYAAAASALIRALPPAGKAMPDEMLSNGLIKHDLRLGRSHFHRFDRHATVSEPAYVTSGDSDREDDGYVLSYVHNPERGASDLVVLSAEDFTARPLARIHLPAPVPLGLHSAWIPDH